MKRSQLTMFPAALALLVGVFLVLFASPSSAQLATPQTETSEPAQEITLPDPLTPDAVRELVSRLSDAEVRELLLKRLDAVAQSSVQGEEIEQEGIFELFGRWAVGVYTSVADAVARGPEAGDPEGQHG